MEEKVFKTDLSNATYDKFIKEIEKFVSINNIEIDLTEPNLRLNVMCNYNCIFHEPAKHYESSIAGWNFGVTSYYTLDEVSINNEMSSWSMYCKKINIDEGCIKVFIENYENPVLLLTPKADYSIKTIYELKK